MIGVHLAGGRWLGARGGPIEERLTCRRLLLACASMLRIA